MKFKFDWFLKGMLIAVALAFLWPSPGAKGGFLHPELLNKIGIALVFYLNGLGLSLVHTNKTLKRLLALKAIRWKDRVFEMIDRDALAAVAGEDIAPSPSRPFI